MRPNHSKHKVPVHEAAAPPVRRILSPPSPAAAPPASSPPSNYKVVVILGDTPPRMVLLTATLDTGAGSNFIRTAFLPDDAKVRPPSVPWKFVDANGRPLRIGGMATVDIRLGSLVIPVDFLVVDSLSAAMILGCSFIDTHVKAIRPQSKLVTFVDGTSVPIRAASIIGLPLTPPASTPQDPRIRISKWLVLPAGKSLYITARSLVSGLAVLRPLLERKDKPARVRIYGHTEEIQAGKDFQIKLSNKSSEPFRVDKDMVVGWVQRRVLR